MEDKRYAEDLDMEDKRYAEDLGHYWKTSRTGVDGWNEKTKKLLEKHNADILAIVYAEQGGVAGIQIEFAFGEEMFKIVWPVLESKAGDTEAAKRQAATLLHHHVKSRLIDLKLRGPKFAFMPWLVLPDGKPVHHHIEQGQMMDLPKLLCE